MQPKAMRTAGSARRSGPGRRLRRPLARRRSFEPVQAVAHAHQPEGADADGEQQHDALEERLPERVEVEDEEEVADGAEGERAEDGADGAAAAARAAATPPRTTAAME